MDSTALAPNFRDSLRSTPVGWHGTMTAVVIKDDVILPVWSHSGNGVRLLLEDVIEGSS
ncbi:MAG TPA: hypothetical protein VK074_02920 [Fodinibius sp.]|nr:hypothetical protein [Fodinibius sp.]